MAQKVVVEIEDDLDGSQAAETVAFALDGAAYEIDLSEDNAAELRDALAQFIDNGRRLGGRRRTSAAKVVAAAKPTVSDRERNQAIRAWARDEGYEVSERGRIPSDVVSAYDGR
ncbi:nucleoid-associated protein Lsr2 [Amycolatopsis antarctica]|uniref:Nucleoid-associated protein Lsr2 n=1 Tax=Amycolatopsis antarctica TaxID=1854586 RepID=A0A263D6I3_9PSEU|nr:Lsr2 family protein [Amycolatopsis antarctica]OZM73086.1 nucleoid-associated protein Lsr2 [Amycolatopsis antarctica]